MSGREREREADALIAEMENAAKGMLNQSIFVSRDQGYHSPAYLRLRNAREALRSAILRSAPVEQQEPDDDDVRADRAIDAIATEIMEEIGPPRVWSGWEHERDEIRDILRKHLSRTPEEQQTKGVRE